MAGKRQVTLNFCFGGNKNAKSKATSASEEQPEDSNTEEKIVQDDTKQTATCSEDTPSSPPESGEKENVAMDADNGSEPNGVTKAVLKRSGEKTSDRATKRVRRPVIESDSDTDVDNAQEETNGKVEMDEGKQEIEGEASKAELKSESVSDKKITSKTVKKKPTAKATKTEKTAPVAAGKSKSKKDGNTKPAEPSSTEDSPEVEEADDTEKDEQELDTAAAAKETAKLVGGKLAVSDSKDWKQGAPVSYAALCKTFEEIEATTKRLQIIAFLTAFFKKVIQYCPKDLLACVYLCLNRIGPEYEGKELGIGESILIKAVASATGRSAQAIKTDLDTQGDLGLVAQSSKGNQKTMFPPPPLTVSFVFKTLHEIASISGQSSQSLKIGKINKLLVACKGNEPKYLIRSLEGKLRIGLAEQSILQALGNASVLSDPAAMKLSEEKRAAKLADAGPVLKHVYNELPNYDEIVPSLLKYGISDLAKHCKLRPGVPLKPMLAHPTKSLTEVLDRFTNMTFTCEYKYDGERAQIHLLEDGQMRVYSRNSENLSAKYPDIIEAMPKILKPSVTSFVLDCEAVAWDRNKKCILPFQVLSTRKRKDVQTADIEVQVCVFAFDILYLNGAALTGQTLKARRELLYENFNEKEGIFLFAKHQESSNVEEIQTFLDESVEGNCEGLMVKTLEKEASYEPSKRSRNWLKVKKDYLAGVGDTFDLVVIGGYTGKGKRTGWYGGFLLACYDEDREEYQSICKIGTGFSEEQLAQHSTFLKSHIIPAPKSYYKWTDSPNLRPDVWFDPVQVWEVKAADLSISPVHKAAMGLVDPNKGISLRFPRFMRIRDDKKAEQATNATQIAEFYQSQKINGVGGD